MQPEHDNGHRHSDPDRPSREFVERRVRRATGQRALREIRRMVDGYEAEFESQRRTRNAAIVVLACLFAGAVVLFAWPYLARLVSGVIG